MLMGIMFNEKKMKEKVDSPTFRKNNQGKPH